MKTYYEGTFGGRARFFTGAMEVEHEALAQLRNIASLPILGGHIAVMPDVHMGKGATVGSVIPTEAALIPAAIGVDIGGMIAVRTALAAADLPESLAAVRSQIERDVPVGFEYHQSEVRLARHGATGAALARRRDSLLGRFASLAIMRRVGRFDEGRMIGQLSTLGGGNHFIELCLDEEQRVWIMLHSGSRNVGKTIGEAAVATAKAVAARESITLVDRDLAWLAEGTAEFDEYVEALHWAQEYASLNRDMMLQLVLAALAKALGRDAIRLTDEAINCHHNYAQKEAFGGKSVWITRKGAVSARSGQMGIIPGSMGARSYIVCGKGNEEAYCSCSHGAGRRMSRGAAKRAFSLDDLAQQTAGVECRKDAGVLDEIPGAYKDIDQVMLAQADLVEVRHTLKQIMCVKG
jgi:tRNA-splicing ligase RtcB